MKRILITLLLAVCAVVTAAAQNRIDKLTSEFSSSGGSYTSVVERTPDTRKIRKVVKELTMDPSPSVKKRFEQAFRDEGKNWTLINLNQNTDKHTMILTVDTKESTCVYMMRGRDSKGRNRLVVTIIKTFK